MIKKNLELFVSTNAYEHTLLINSTNQNLNEGVLYAVISHRELSKIIILFDYTNTTNYPEEHISCPIVFKADRARTIYKLIELHVAIFNQITTSHAFYLGIELMKAEFSLIMEHNYIQN